MSFGCFVIVSTFHIVTFQSSVRSRYGYYKNNYLVFQRSYQIIYIYSIILRPLLLPFTSYMEVGNQYYVLLSIELSLPERVYFCSSTQSALGLNLSSVVHQGSTMVRLINKVIIVLPGLYTIIYLLTYQRSPTQSAA